MIRWWSHTPGPINGIAQTLVLYIKVHLNNVAVIIKSYNIRLTVWLSLLLLVIDLCKHIHFLLIAQMIITLQVG